MKTKDCRGLNCPEPVLKTKQALEEGAPAGLTVIVDNEGSKNNVERLARSQGCTATTTASADGSYEVVTTGLPAVTATQNIDPAAFACNPAGNGSLICVIPADSIGRGSDELWLDRGYLAG